MIRITNSTEYLTWDNEVDFEKQYTTKEVPDTNFWLRNQFAKMLRQYTEDKGLLTLCGPGHKEKIFAACRDYVSYDEIAAMVWICSSARMTIDEIRDDLRIISGEITRHCHYDSKDDKFHMEVEN